MQNSASGTNVLSVNSSTYSVCIDYSSCTNALAVNGTVYASAGFTSSGSPDVAEYIPVASGVQAYDVVSANPDGSVGAVDSSTSYDTSAIGVISDGSSSFIGNAPGDGKSASGQMPIVLAGRVPVHVTNMNGAIEPGDYLTTSSIPGYAMLATEPGPTIGKALAAFNGTSGTVMALINVSYYAGPSTASYVQNGGNATLTGLTVSGTADFADLNASGTATINDLSVQSIADTGNLSVGGNLTVTGLTTLADIEISGHIITVGKTPAIIVASSLCSGDTVSISGNDTAGTITITTASGSLNCEKAGILTKVTYSSPFSSAPHISLTAASSAAAGAQAYIDNASNNGTSYDLDTNTALSAGQTYIWYYQTIQ